MKETKTESPTTIDAKDLILNGIYFNVDNHLVQVKQIDESSRELRLFNISENYTMYNVKFDRHTLVTRVR
jgi:hypothetical protein